MWLSNLMDFKNVYIGLSFPEADEIESVKLSAKKRNTELAKQNKVTLPPEHVFSEDDQALLDRHLKASFAILRQKYSNRPFVNDPTKAWCSSNGLPKQTDAIVTVTDGYILVSKACVTVLNQFKVGNNRFIPLSIYEYNSEEFLGDDLWYLLELSDWRSFFIPEKSSPRCKPLHNRNYDKGNYQNHRALSYLHTDEFHAMSLDSNNCDLDLWHEPQLNESICVSDRLKQALEDAGMADAWRFQSCKLVASID